MSTANAVEYGNLPPVDSLTDEQAERVALLLRSEIRRKLMEKLTGTREAPASTDQAMAFIERWETEFRILESEKYEFELCRKLIPGEYAQPQLSDPEITAPGCCKVRASLFLSPESSHYVHGPVLVYHAVKACEAVIDASDRITRINEIKFAKEVSTQVEILVRRPSLAGRKENKNDSRLAVFSGSVETESGENLEFLGIPVDGYSVSRAVGYFSLPTRILTSDVKKLPNNIYRIPLHNSAGDAVTAACHHLSQTARCPGDAPSTPWVAYLLTAILTQGLTLVRRNSGSSLKMIMCRNLYLPDCTATWLGNAEFLEIQVASSRRQGVNETRFLRGSSSFRPVQQDRTMGMMAEVPSQFIQAISRKSRID